MKNLDPKQPYPIVRRKLFIKEDLMPSSVYKIIEVVGSSTKSWEDAAKVAIDTASKTLKDLRIAEVVNQDVKIDGNTLVFRTSLRISFKYHDHG
jgi:flavin-binding protein dodecin